MKKFFDAVKVNLLEDAEKYFNEVEVESVKKSKDNNTLNFYLLSHDLIPYKFIKDAENEIARQLFNVNIDLQRNPVHIYLKYNLSSTYTPSLVFEDMRVDLFKELKDKDRVLATIFDTAKYAFNDNILTITFDENEAFEDEQNDLLMFIKSVYSERFFMPIEIKVRKEKFDFKRKAPQFYENDAAREEDRKENANEVFVNVKEENETKEPETKDKQGSKKRRGKNGWGFNDEGDILYGREPKGRFKTIDISETLTSPEGISVKIVADIYNYSIKDVKNGKVIFKLNVNDHTGSLAIRLWGDPDDKKLFGERFKIGDTIEVCGQVLYDTYESTMIVKPILVKKLMSRTVVEFGKPGEDDYYNVFITNREDNEKEKRVELHLHTKSSAKDGIGEVKAYIATAIKWGMQSMAITDHGCVNALADAYEYIEELKKKKKPGADFKIINGVEGYLVEDFEAFYFDKNNNEVFKSHGFNDTYIVYDLQTTGYNRHRDGVVKLVATKIKSREKIDGFSAFIKFDKPINLEIREKIGIKEEDIKNAKTLKEVLSDFVIFAKDSLLVTLNKNSTWKLSDLLYENDITCAADYLDLMILSRAVLTELKTFDLFALAKELKIKIAKITDKTREEKKKGLNIDDEITLASTILIALLNKIKEDFGIDDISLVKTKINIGPEFLKRQKSYHIILLAKNDVGRVNLYKLISDSHRFYMYKKPRIPRSLLMKYREGLIVGSACILGEFMNAIKEGRSDAVLRDIASFYDYLEIQPTTNNSFLLRDDPENFKTLEDLENLNKKVVEIADALNKPVVATCDCHYVDKEDKIDREILIFGSMYKASNKDKDGKIKEDASADLESSDANEELYFRNTREMLDEFAYLGTDKAYEIVVKNTKHISDMIENIIPVRLDKCTPKIEGSDDLLVKTCKDNLKKIYGDNLQPDSPIVKRLDKELEYIIENGYSVMYIAAKNLIEFSKEYGYPVGSRGSVGSSLAATLAGVSEVNPLPPHYICPKCHYLEYETAETKKYNNESGFDMPDKKCPECGAMMQKDGVNIPFETFLGIPGDLNAQKEPDIDLNFCSVFQNKIHDHTVEMFGKDNTFKAGTVGTVAMKTAYGYVLKYKENHTGFDISKDDILYHRNKIVNCKNTSGQHPGGMIVVPNGEYIYTFTPVQHPADKEGDENVTTHFDYHKIDKNLLKLDILGHDAPLLLKKLFEYTGIDFNTVPFYDKEVLCLFKNTESLGIKPSDISGTRLGCLTIPEFGTDNAMNMCEEAKPESVSDLIRISGLAHGTDVWNNNVRDLIKNGDCTLKNAICCRDDIMLYLIDKGLDHGLSFTIMESVRKGKGLTTQWEDEMRKHEVPEWYIGCCKKIQYMFPKAHAAAYVLAGLRIGYYKIHYPLEYYAAYFSVRKDGFDYLRMLQDKEEIHYQIEALSKRSKSNNKDDELSTKEKDLYMCYRIVEEMKARGMDFMPLDIYKAKANDFIIVGNKIMPSFDSIAGIGEEVAKKLEIEANKGEYTSIENFRVRTSVTKTKIAEMKEIGILPDMRENDENTLFDLLK